MATTQRFTNFRGINTRDIELNPTLGEATDLKNVRLNKKGELIKREGTEEVQSSLGTLGSFRYVKDNEIYVLGTAGVYDESGTLKSNPSSITVDSTNRANFVEKNGNVYIYNGVNEVLKYDGLSVYRAGVTNAYPSNIVLSGSGFHASGAADESYTFMLQFYSRDKNGIVTYGEYTEPTSSMSSPPQLVSYATSNYCDLQFVGPKLSYDNIGAVSNKWAQNTLYNSGDIVYAPDGNAYSCNQTHTSSTGGTASDDFQQDLVDTSIIPTGVKWFLIAQDLEGFNTKVAIVNGAQTYVNTVTVDSGHTIEVGDVIYTKPSSEFLTELTVATIAGRPTPIWEYYRTVTAIAATTITFDGIPADFDDNEVLNAGLRVVVYAKSGIVTSTNEYFIVGDFAVDPTTVLQTVRIDFNSAAAFGFDQFGGEIVSTQVRGIPPKAKFGWLFQDLLFTSDGTSLRYSSTASVESFPPNDNELLIGDDPNESITGGIGIDDFNMIFKEKSTHFATGTFGLNQNLRVWRTFDQDVGCQSHASIVAIGGEVIFLSHKGVFSLTANSSPSEIGFNINNLITEDTTGLQLTESLAIHDEINQLYLLHVPATVTSNSLWLVYDYVYQGWFIYRDLDASKGLSIKDGVFHFVETSGDLVRAKSTRNDQGAAIDAYWRSVWENLGDPAIEKKFLNLKTFSLSNEAFTVDIKTEKDFAEGTYWTDSSQQFLAATKHVRNKLKSETSEVLRLSYENDTLDENMVISGYEIEYEATQRKMNK